MSDRTYYVYILTNNLRTVLYVGITNDLKRRVWEHQHGSVQGFTKRYHISKIMHYEETPDVLAAIQREKVIKGKSRAWKEGLIASMNPHWKDLAERFQCEDSSLRSE